LDTRQFLVDEEALMQGMKSRQIFGECLAHRPWQFLERGFRGQAGGEVVYCDGLFGNVRVKLYG
jgi:hypothetical protein